MVTLKNSLHDKSEMVRAAFLDLLIKMKEVRAAKVGGALANMRWKYHLSLFTLGSECENDFFQFSRI